jgi:hypothetical protein
MKEAIQNRAAEIVKDLTVIKEAIANEPAVEILGHLKELSVAKRMNIDRQNYWPID